MFSIAAEVRNTLGECPLWCERTRRLYWTDIEACSGQLKLATVLEFFQYRFSDSFGGNPPL